MCSEPARIAGCSNAWSLRWQTTRPSGIATTYAVVEDSRLAGLDEARADRDPETVGERGEAPGGGPVGDGLGERRERGHAEAAQEPVAREAALGKGDDAGAALRGLLRKTREDAEVPLLVAGRALHLHGRDAHVLHRAVSRAAVAFRAARSLTASAFAR